MSGTFRAGWAEIDLTPDKKVRLAGQFCERISEYVETPVCATALALDTGDDVPYSAPVIWWTSG